MKKGSYWRSWEIDPSTIPPGAVDLDACPNRRPPSTACWCAPKCKHCGFGPHMAIHGPKLHQPPGSEPWGHEYEAEELADA